MESLKEYYFEGWVRCGDYQGANQKEKLIESFDEMEKEIEDIRKNLKEYNIFIINKQWNRIQREIWRLFHRVSKYSNFEKWA